MDIRNIAIIAHVDHGKTTLVDQLLRQSGMFRDNQHLEERMMDSNDLEKERGITILAKCTSIDYNDIRINIIDTPGHSDFAGEVERILSMVDGVVLLVDASEGAMPQTKFVTSKALALGLRPILVINKVDKVDARPMEVHEEILDLFISLEATDDQLDFPTIFASGKNGWASLSVDEKKSDLTDLYNTILDFIPAPKVEKEKPFSMLATLLASDNYVGRILTGKVESGKVKVNDELKIINPAGLVEKIRATKLFAFKGINRVPISEAAAGEIIAIAGMEKGTVADTICALEVSEPIKAIAIDPPVISMQFAVNNSPMSGREGTKVTSRVLWDRLLKEAESNVAIVVEETADKEMFKISGRGELQMAVLIETMRREGFEISVSKPEVIFKEENGQRLEPIEEVQIDVDEEYYGKVIETLSRRKGNLDKMMPHIGGKTRLIFTAPSRCLIGYLFELLTITRGTGMMTKRFHSYEPYKGDMPSRVNGVLVSMSDGKAVTYALDGLKERGELFINPQTEVYTGMIIGEHNRENDLYVNPIKSKQLTNFRASGKDDAVNLSPPRKITLEYAMTYIASDELVEITPSAIRLRKKDLRAK